MPVFQIEADECDPRIVEADTMQQALDLWCKAMDDSNEDGTSVEFPPKSCVRLNDEDVIRKS